MNREQTMQAIVDTGVVAIVRGTTAASLADMVEALRRGGIRAIEVAFNTPHAAPMIEELADKHASGMIVGAGTVLDPETARTAIMAGARFVLSPTLHLGVVETCLRYAIPVIPGAMTPTEVLTAWSAGATLVKVFPAGTLGSRYFKDLQGPLPQVSLMAVGGVNLDNAPEFIRAGAVGLGIGGELVDKTLVAEGRWDELTRRAGAFISAVAKAREVQR